MSSSDEGYAYYSFSLPEPKEEFKLPEGFVEKANPSMHTRDLNQLREGKWLDEAVYKELKRKEPIPLKNDIAEAIRLHHEHWCRTAPIGQVSAYYGRSEEDVEAARQQCYSRNFFDSDGVVF